MNLIDNATSINTCIVVAHNFIFIKKIEIRNMVANHEMTYGDVLLDAIQARDMKTVKAMCMDDDNPSIDEWDDALYSAAELGNTTITMYLINNGPYNRKKRWHMAIEGAMVGRKIALLSRLLADKTCRRHINIAGYLSKYLQDHYDLEDDLEADDLRDSEFLADILHDYHDDAIVRLFVAYMCEE